MRPAFVELGVPEREVLEPEDLPHAILLDVLILIYAAFPPLYQPAWVRIFDTLVRTSRHHAPEAPLGARAIAVHIDNALNLGMVEKEAMYGTIAASYEGFGEAINVKTFYAFLAIIAAT